MAVPIEPEVLSPAEAERMRHEEAMMKMRVKLARIELAKMAMQMKGLPSEISAPTAPAVPPATAPVAKSDLPTIETATEKASKPTKSVDESRANWLRSNPPYIGEPSEDHFQRYRCSYHGAGSSLASYHDIMRRLGYHIIAVPDPRDKSCLVQFWSK
jgi:hypothetical protein